MSYEEDDAVVLHDEHSDFDGEQGTITQIVDTMFGDANYTVSFEDGQETGVPEDNLEVVEDADEAASGDGEAAEDDAVDEA